MKLYVSSVGIPDMHAFANLVGKQVQKIKLCIIFNAMDYKDPLIRKERFLNTVKTFREQGLTDVTELNLHDFTNAESIKNKLLKYDAVWLNGGNVYLLRYLLKTSCCDTVLRKIAESGVILAGDSAGAVVLGPTLKHYDIADDPNEAPEVLWNGLGLIDTAILPHWGSEKFQMILDTVEKKLLSDNYKTKRLSDGEFKIFSLD